MRHNGIHHHRQGPGDHTEGHSRASPVKTGDRVKFFVHPDGSVVLLQSFLLSALRGMIKSRRQRPVTTAEMTAAAAEGAAGATRRAARR